MIQGKITSKSQTTVPKAVRIALGLKPGDDVAWDIDGGEVKLVRVDKAAPDMFIGNFSTFTEWESDEDRIGYANL